MSTGRRPRLVLIAAALVLAALARPAYSAEGIPELLQQTYWGESSEALLRQFGSAAMRLPHGIDFGDSYTDLVLYGQTVGGVPVIVFFQMDKATRGLKRIQLERPRHGVNPPAFRAIAAALYRAYGEPDRICAVPVLPMGGYQEATQEIWIHGADAISAIYRDTTLEAFEGCYFGLTSGPCGLRGQLLVRISPADGIPKPDPCGLALHYSHPIPSPSSNR
jgi:hypothetical protein